MSKTVIFGAKIGALPDPARAGYSFITWSKTKAEGNAVNADMLYNVTADMTLYAIWKANSYKVSFDAFGGDASTDEITVD